MAVASMSDAIVDKGLLTRKELASSLARAEKSIEQDDRHRLSDANRAATLFPIRLLILANQAAEKGKNFTFSELAAMVGKLT